MSLSLNPPLASTLLVTLTLAAPAIVRAEALDAVADPAAPQSAPALDAATQERLRQLEEHVRKLTEEIERLKQAQKPEAVGKLVEERLKKQKPVAELTNQGFAITSADGNNQIRLRGLLQSDFRAATRPSGRTNIDNFFLRRVRPTIDGTLQKYVDFRLQPDFGAGAAVIQDAYVQLNYFPSAQVRFGKFKGPFSLEFLQSGGETLFIERAVSNALTPLRDVGIQVGGEVFGGRGTYHLGLFNGTSDSVNGDVDGGNDKEFAIRLFATPWKPNRKSPLHGLGFGVGMTLDSRDEAATPLAYRSASRTPYFRYTAGTMYDGRVFRLAPQMHFYHGSFGFMSELLQSSQQLLNGAARRELNHRGWMVQSSYVLTGEDTTYRGVTPRKPFDPKKGTWGAFEIAARYSRLNLDDDAFAAGFADPALSAGRAEAFTLGLNWYMNRALKLQLNYEHTSFDRAVTFGANTTDHEDVFLARFQIQF